ncbi:MAG: hypothetical protein ACRCYE_14555 [Sarcina sp.]
MNRKTTLLIGAIGIIVGASIITIAKLTPDTENNNIVHKTQLNNTGHSTVHNYNNANLQNN